MCVPGAVKDSGGQGQLHSGGILDLNPQDEWQLLVVSGGCYRHLPAQLPRLQIVQRSRRGGHTVGDKKWGCRGELRLARGGCWVSN